MITTTFYFAANHGGLQNKFPDSPALVLPQPENGPVRKSLYVPIRKRPYGVCATRMKNMQRPEFMERFL